MKERVVSCFVLLSAILLATSCSDDETKPDNHFTLDGLKKELKGGVLFYDAESMDNDVTGEVFYRNDLALYGGFELVTEDDGEIELSGEGNALYLSINTASQSLEEGTYTWTGTDENPAVFDFWTGDVYISYNTVTEDGESWEFTDGEIVVSKSDNKYTIALTGTISADLDHDGIFTDVQVSASYKGKVTHALD